MSADSFDAKIDITEALGVLTAMESRSAVQNVTNQLVTRARRETKTRILSRYNLKSRDLNILLSRARPGRDAAYLYASRRRLSLGKFQPKQTSEGVSVKVQKGSGILIPRAFLARPKGRVWKQYGQKRPMFRQSDMVLIRKGMKPYELKSASKDYSISIGELIGAHWNLAAINSMIMREAPRLFYAQIAAKIQKRSQSVD